MGTRRKYAVGLASYRKTLFEIWMSDLSTIDPNQVEANLWQLAEGMRTHLAYEETHGCQAVSTAWMRPG
jgi:hypothetical protein